MERYIASFHYELSYEDYKWKECGICYSRTGEKIEEMKIKVIKT